MGPDPLLLSRTEVDALYETVAAVQQALTTLHVPWIVTGGTLLGAIRQHSILFCDDDVDLAIVETRPPQQQEQDEADASSFVSYYTRVQQHLQAVLNEQQGPDRYQYQIKPWPGGDRIRPRHVNTVFCDLFVIQPYTGWDHVRQVLATKTNGQPQSDTYVESLVQTMTRALLGEVLATKTNGQPQSEPYVESLVQTMTRALLGEPNQQQEEDDDNDDNRPVSDQPVSPHATTTTTRSSQRLFPVWHFSTRKAMELWPKEIYRPYELFPLALDLKLGPLTQIPGPAMPVRLLHRAFGTDCFDVYYTTVVSHQQPQQQQQSANQQPQQHQNKGLLPAISQPQTPVNATHSDKSTTKHHPLPPHVLTAGTWEGGVKVPLEEFQYIPLQPTRRQARRFTNFNRHQLVQYLSEQMLREATILQQHHAQLQHDQDQDYEPTSAAASPSSREPHVSSPKECVGNSWGSVIASGCSTNHQTNHSKNSNQKEEQGKPTNRPNHSSNSLNSNRHSTNTTVHSTDSHPLQPSATTRATTTTTRVPDRPHRTVYMDGVFDLFHLGHLKAIQQCSALGTVVIIGVTGDADAAGYKRPPIVPQDERSAIVAALDLVHAVICPCPLVVTSDFMNQQGIDLVVHGFASDQDAAQQATFFAQPIRRNQFQRIDYYPHVSTTDRLARIYQLEHQRLQQEQQEVQQEEQLDQEQQPEPQTVDKLNDNNQTKMASSNEPISNLPHNTQFQNDAKDDMLAAPTSNSSNEPQEEQPSMHDMKTKTKGTSSSSSTTNKEWLGTAMAHATHHATFIPVQPFSLPLRMVLEPHLEKARKNRREALTNILSNKESGSPTNSHSMTTMFFATNNSVVDLFLASALAQERDFCCKHLPPVTTSNTNTSPMDLRTSFLSSVGLLPDFDLSQLHKVPSTDKTGNHHGISKDQLLYNLTQNYESFQHVYDEFVRTVCIPHVVQDGGRDDKDQEEEEQETVFYYQAFPCLRVIQPKEFSIGPHSDIAYGHHPCCVNFYVPLTTIAADQNTSTVFLESRPGSEDWHPILGGYGTSQSVGLR